MQSLIILSRFLGKAINKVMGYVNMKLMTLGFEIPMPLKFLKSKGERTEMEIEKLLKRVWELIMTSGEDC